MVRASVECWPWGARSGDGDMRLNGFVGWAVSQKCPDTCPATYPFIRDFIFFRYLPDTYLRRIGAVSVSDMYRTRDTWPESRVRVTHGLFIFFHNNNVNYYHSKINNDENYG